MGDNELSVCVKAGGIIIYLFIFHFHGGELPVIVHVFCDLYVFFSVLLAHTSTVTKT